MSDWLKVSDGSTWPKPMGEVEWALRYGTPTRGELLSAASILSAYGVLTVEATQARRNLVCREIRAAWDSDHSNGSEGI